ncbi:N-6 DNA methylase [Microvirga makkahensis]|nr:N-6 DNA methylase [Microvirga makkahensis]
MPSLATNVIVNAGPTLDITCVHPQGFSAGHPASDLNFDFKRLRLTTGEATVEAARGAAHAAAVGWWDALLLKYSLPSATIRPAKTPVDCGISEDAQEGARAFGAELAKLRLDDAVARLGQLYTRLLPKQHRSSNGIFYTPVPLVQHLADRVSAAGMDWLRGKVISPACGGGQFLVEDARRMIAAMNDADPAIVIASIGARLRGWDSDPFACWLSQLAVEACLLPQVIASGKRLARITECRNSLLEDWSDHAGTYDLVNENPPFGKVKDTPEFRRLFGRSLHGHPNVYGMFMDLGAHLAKPNGGIIALVTPTSYLGGQYFKALRRTVAELAPPVAIDLVESRRDVFPDVLQEVALSIFVRGAPGRTTACSIVQVMPDGLQISDAGTMQLPTSPTDPWLIARSPENVRLVSSMRAMPTRLADWGYSVSTGPLVWDRAKKAGRLHSIAGAGRIPVMWAEAVGRAGRFCPSYEQRADKSFYEPEPGKTAGLVTDPCLLLKRTTAKEQARRLVGAVLPESFLRAHGAVAVENHLNMVKPRTGAKVPLQTLAAFFATDIADRVMRCISGSVAISAAEIEAMPLPSVEDLTAAMASQDPEAALRSLYGTEDVVSEPAAP